MSHDCYLAFDFGLKRVGVACGNTLMMKAQPLPSIVQQGEQRFAKINSLIQDWQPVALVVGVPFYPDGVAHEVTMQARRFARQLNGRYQLQVHEVDERYSSVEAQRMAPKDLDSMAAVIILEQFFFEQNASLS